MADIKIAGMKINPGILALAAGGGVILLLLNRGQSASSGVTTVDQGASDQNTIANLSGRVEAGLLEISNLATRLAAVKPVETTTVPPPVVVPSTLAGTRGGSGASIADNFAKLPDSVRQEFFAAAQSGRLSPGTFTTLQSLSGETLNLDALQKFSAAQQSELLGLFRTMSSTSQTAIADLLGLSTDMRQSLGLAAVVPPAPTLATV